MYVTRDGYRPTRKLTWSALEAKPFLRVQDPPRRGGSYVFSGSLPKGKSGRHLIYTIWQTSDTPDTYYSCSDVVFSGPKGAVKAVPKPGKRPSGAASRTARAVRRTTAPPVPTPNRTRNVAGTGTTSLMVAGGGAALLLVLSSVATVVLLRRGRIHREF
jgi:chitin-binding protein